MRLNSALLLIAISTIINAENKHHATDDPDLDLEGALIDDPITTKPPSDPSNIAFASALQLQPPRPVSTSPSNNTTNPATSPTSTNQSNQTTTTTTSTAITQFIPTQTAIPPRNPINGSAAAPHKHTHSMHSLLLIVIGYTMIGIGY
ncbi:putative signal peptide protein [Puccinia sorghi]|uniref:Putative signal peptide protein n=1 Tax=Puccinia sorghi TaxID=27349 RepID=A0A0L6V7S7_9BASI|nr:putative signal peptide protein [Puccinia sorghi]